MPSIKSPVKAPVESLRTPPVDRRANTSNTRSSNRDNESPVASSYGEKSGLHRKIWGSFKTTFGKGVSKDLKTSPSPRSRRRWRKPIPEFCPADPKERSSTKLHHAHSESHERPETASARSAKKSDHSSQKPPRRNSIGSLFGFGSIRNWRGSKRAYRRDYMDTTPDLLRTFSMKPDVCIVNNSGDDVNYGSKGFTYYSSVKKAPKPIIDCPASKPDNPEGGWLIIGHPASKSDTLERSQPREEGREAKTPDSYLELLIRGAESPYVEPNDYDNLFATPCRSSSRHVHYTDLASSTTTAKQKSASQKKPDDLSIEAGNASLCAAFGDFGLDFHQRLEDREERYHTLTTQSNSTPAIQKRFSDCREPNAALQTDWRQIDDEMTHEIIRKVVARMRKNRHSSSLTVSDPDFSSAMEEISPPSDDMSFEKDSTEVKEVIRRGKAIKEVIREEVTTMTKSNPTEDTEIQAMALFPRRFCPHFNKFFDRATSMSTSPENSNRGEKPTTVKKLKPIPSIGQIKQRDNFTLKTLEDSIEIRTPLEIPPYLHTKPLPYRIRSPIDLGKGKMSRRQTRTRTVQNIKRLPAIFVEFPKVEDKPMQLRRYNSRSDAMAALYESCQNCDYPNYFIWKPRLRLYTAVPHDSPMPDAEELKRYGYELVRVPMRAEVYNRGSILGDLRPFHADGNIIANDNSFSLKAESLSLKPYESSYDAETAFMKMPLRRPEKQNSCLYLKANSKIVEETKEIESKVPEGYFLDHENNSIGESFAGNNLLEETESNYFYDHEIISIGESFAGNDFAEGAESSILEGYTFEHEIDSSIGRSFLGSDYSASPRAMDISKSLRIHREVIGSDIYDPSGPERVPPSKTWFDLAKEYKARHPVEKDLENSEDPPAVGESYGDANRYEVDFVEVCSEISSTTCDKIMEELGLQEIICNGTQISRSSWTCPEPTFRDAEYIAREEKRPVVVVTEIVPSEGEPSRNGTPTVGLSSEKVNDAYPPRMTQESMLSSMRKRKRNKKREQKRKLHPGSADSKDVEADSQGDDSSHVDDTDESDFSITEVPSGFKFSKFESVLKDIANSLTPAEGSRETKSLRPKPPHIELGSLPRNNAVISFGSMKGKLPLRPEYTPIFGDLEPFDKAENLKSPSRSITPDDLNIRMVGKAARQSQLAKPEGRKVGALVDVFQAHGLMSQRLRPELIRVPSPASPQHQPSGRPPTPVPWSPSKEMPRPHGMNYEASSGPQSSTRVPERAAGPTSRPEGFGSHSDAETETSIVFGVELERVEARLQHNGEERAYRDSELYG